jgi:hypothetical protein
MTGSPVWKKDDEGMAVCIMCVSCASLELLSFIHNPYSYSLNIDVVSTASSKVLPGD